MLATAARGHSALLRPAQLAPGVTQARVWYASHCFVGLGGLLRSQGDGSGGKATAFASSRQVDRRGCAWVSRLVDGGDGGGGGSSTSGDSRYVPDQVLWDSIGCYWWFRDAVESRSRLHDTSRPGARRRTSRSRSKDCRPPAGYWVDGVPLDREGLMASSVDLRTPCRRRSRAAVASSGPAAAMASWEAKESVEVFLGKLAYRSHGAGNPD